MKFKGRGGKAAAAAIVIAGIGASSALGGLVILPIPKEYETDVQPISVAVGNIGGTKAKDIAVANANGRSVSVLLGKAQADFRDAVSYDTLDGKDATGVAIGKVNADQRTDLVVTADGNQPGSDALLVYRGKAQGFRAPKPYPLGTASAQDLALTDLDRDGRLDAVVGDSASSSVAIKYGKGNGEFGQTRNYAYPGEEPSPNSEPQRVTVGDFDRNGFKDVAVSIGRRGEVGVLYAKTKRVNGKTKAKRGAFRKRAYDVAGLPLGIAAGDLNRDGRLDLVTPADYNAGTESISVLLGKGKGVKAGFRAYQEVDVGEIPFGGSIAIGRFDPGPVPDVAVGLNNGDMAYLYGKAAGGFEPPYEYGFVSGAFDLTAARLNDDAESDLVVPQWTEGNVAIVLEEGDGQ